MARTTAISPSAVKPATRVRVTSVPSTIRYAVAVCDPAPAGTEPTTSAGEGVGAGVVVTGDPPGNERRSRGHRRAVPLRTGEPRCGGRHRPGTFGTWPHRWCRR